MYLLKKDKQASVSLHCKQSSPSDLKTLATPLAQKIVQSLSLKDSYPKGLSKELKVHEQKIYYHIKKLEKAGIIKKTKSENVNGVMANYYGLHSPAFALTFKEFQPHMPAFCKEEGHEFFKPFIEQGALNALIIMGSPTSHGEHHSRSRDARPATELCLLLGTHLSQTPDPKDFKFDTEIKKEDLQNNLIILGGPIVNSLTSKVNKHLPIRFSNKKIYSSCSKKRYSHDETGMVVKTANPFNKNASVLVIAGNTHMGTKSCITGLYKKLEEIAYGNRHKPRIKAKIIEGLDITGDGEPDDVTILE